jgi:hypothetical protein
MERDGLGNSQGIGQASGLKHHTHAGPRLWIARIAAEQASRTRIGQKPPRDQPRNG